MSNDETGQDTNKMFTELPLADAFAIGKDVNSIASRYGYVHHPEDPDVQVPVALVQQGGGAARIEVMNAALDLLDQRRSGPRRRVGAMTMTDSDSFATACNRWGAVGTSVIYAEPEDVRFTCVINEHPIGELPEDTDWRDHRVIYSCPRSMEWIAWTSRVGRPLTQMEFGDWIEERLEDLTTTETTPSPLDVLAVARKLSIRTKGIIHREVDVDTGNYHMIDKAEHETGSTVIPRRFAIAIPVFDGGVRYQVEVRVRFAVKDGAALFTLTMHHQNDIERTAFDETRTMVGAKTGMQILNGSPDHDVEP